MIDTEISEEIEMHLYDDMLETLSTYADNPYVSVSTIADYLDDPTLVSSAGKEIPVVTVSKTNTPEKTIYISAGRHSTEYGGVEGAVEAIERIADSEELSSYLETGEIVIIPIVHVDAYSMTPKERKSLFRGIPIKSIRDHLEHPEKYKPTKELLQCYDADRNKGHNLLLYDNYVPDYQGPMDAAIQEQTNNVLSKEAYAVARLFEDKAQTSRVLCTVDMHETIRPYFDFTVLYWDTYKDDGAGDITEAVSEKYPVKEPKKHSNQNTFSGFATTKKIDSFTFEGTAYDQDEKRPLKERVEQQLLALDAVFDLYCT